MSFICGLCSIYTKPGQKATRVVTATREKTYPYREDAHIFVREGKKEVKDDRGGTGWEIAKEVLACQPCAEAYNESKINT